MWLWARDISANNPENLHILQWRREVSYAGSRECCSLNNIISSSIQEYGNSWCRLFKTKIIGLHLSTSCHASTLKVYSLAYGLWVLILHLDYLIPKPTESYPCLFVLGPILNYQFSWYFRRNFLKLNSQILTFQASVQYTVHIQALGRAKVYVFFCENPT